MGMTFEEFAYCMQNTVEETKKLSKQYPILDVCQFMFSERNPLFKYSPKNCLRQFIELLKDAKQEAEQKNDPTAEIFDSTIQDTMFFGFVNALFTQDEYKTLGASSERTNEDSILFPLSSSEISSFYHGLENRGEHARIRLQAILDNNLVESWRSLDELEIYIFKDQKRSILNLDESKFERQYREQQEARDLLRKEIDLTLENTPYTDAEKHAILDICQISPRAFALLKDIDQSIGFKNLPADEVIETLQESALNEKFSRTKKIEIALILNNISSYTDEEKQTIAEICLKSPKAFALLKDTNDFIGFKNLSAGSLIENLQEVTAKQASSAKKTYR